MKDIILGEGNFTLMRIEDSISKMKGIGIVHSDRFNTHGKVDERVDISHVKELDRSIDTVIHFSNTDGVDALINELMLLRADIVSTDTKSPQQD